MRNLKFLQILFLIVFAVPNAWALDARTGVECTGGTHLITVGGRTYEEQEGGMPDGEISGLIFECEAIGVCEPSFFFPEIPLPFESEIGLFGWYYYHAECSFDPPTEGVAYRYTPYGVRSDGSLVPTASHQPIDSRSYALANCEDVPIARGILRPQGYPGENITFLIDTCEPNCWSEDIWAYLNTAMVEELAGLSVTDLVFQVVDVFGSRSLCTMPPCDSHIIARIALAPDGSCGPVPVDKECWGSIKAMFR